MRLITTILFCLTIVGITGCATTDCPHLGKAPKPNVMPISVAEFNAAHCVDVVAGGGNQYEATTEYIGDDGNHYFETLYTENGVVVSIVFWKEVE